MNRPLFRASAALAAAVLMAGLLETSLPASSTAAPPVLQVVGTSDVSDSCLLAPSPRPVACSQSDLHDKILTATGVDVNYTGSATSTAINSAKQGVASVLIVHAVSLENQFVDPPSGPSYSLESAGRSLMWGDFVLAGYTGDPAGVLPSGQHDVVAAYHKIAQAGAANDAHFISRTGGPGTTVQEHAIWKLVSETYPGDIPMCTVSDANGGGMSPGVADTTAGDGTCGTNPTYPAWYSPGNRKQAENIRFADTCVVAGTPYTDCYVFTDRGTLLNLQSEATPEATHLTTVTRNNSPSAPGGFEALVNAFHIYAINPEAVPPNSAIDTVNALKVMDYLTSADGQDAIGGYLPADPPFLPAASPKVTLARTVPASVVGSSPFTVSGSIANKIPGYPKLGGMRVRLKAVKSTTPSATPTTVATTLTTASGYFRLKYAPVANQRYTLTVAAAKRLERGDLSPQFFDLLTGSTTNLGTTSVNGSLKSVEHIHHGHYVKLTGKLSPKVTGNGGELVFSRAKAGERLKPVSVRPLKAGATSFSEHFRFDTGTWRYAVVYQNPGVITAVSSRAYRVTIR